MAKKKALPKRYPAATPEEAKAAVVRFYQTLQLELTLTQQAEVTDREHLRFLHDNIADLERRAPWLKKEALDAAL